MDEQSTRDDDIATKQERLAAMLRDLVRDGLLLLDPANFSWITSGADSTLVVEAADQPAVYLQNSQRWLICSNVDTQRLFDEELDGLGFQVKEWPWQWGRPQLLADLCTGKRLACDVPFADCTNVGERLQTMRRTLSPWERERLRAIGIEVAHALEATCRGINRGDTEQEIAGHLCHRLARHGLTPVEVQVSADSRLRMYRRHVPGTAKVEQTCVVRTTAKKNGLHVTASRAVCFGAPDDHFRQDWETACRWSAVLIAGCGAGAQAAEVIRHGLNYLENVDLEHEWRMSPLGWVTGHASREIHLLPSDSPPTLESGWPVVWLANVGAALSADTILVTDAGPEIMTPAKLWPVKIIKVANRVLERPDLLIRSE